MILNDKQIKKLAEENGMITPYIDKSISKGIASWQSVNAVRVTINMIIFRIVIYKTN